MLTDAVVHGVVRGKLNQRGGCGYWASRLLRRHVVAVESLWSRTEWVYNGKRQVRMPLSCWTKQVRRNCCCASKKVYFLMVAVCKAKFSHECNAYFMHQFVHLCGGENLPYDCQHAHEGGPLERWLFVSQEIACAVLTQGEECGKTAESLILCLSNTKSQDFDGRH